MAVGGVCLEAFNFLFQKALQSIQNILYGKNMTDM